MLKNDKVNFIIALILAIGLWVHVYMDDDQSMDVTIKNVPVTIINEEALTKEDLVLLSVSDETVNVKVKGERGEASKVKKEDIHVVLDLEGLRAGENTVPLQISVPDKVDFKDASKRKVTVTIDELVKEEREIVPVLSGEMSDEREPFIVQTNKETVKVTGAKSVVERVEYVSAPLDVNLVGDELRAINVDLIPVDKDGNPVEDLKLSEKSVSVTAVMLNKKTVPLRVTVTGEETNDAERTVVTPKTITIKGYAADLANISFITAEMIDVSEIYEDTTLPVTPILPEGIEVAASSQNLTAKVTVRGMESRKFVFGKESIIVEGITEDMIAYVQDVKINMTIVGKEENISGLTKADFFFVADATGLEPGEHSITLKCHYEAKLSELEFSPMEVTVVIEKVAVEEPEAGDGAE